MDSERILKTIDADGLLSRMIKGFEARPQQRTMMANVIDAYNNNRITLIEAGTGTGKSLAYLIPALSWAFFRKERTVISTNTINLQEQLINKDIPDLVKALNLKLKAVLVKGMNNYICKRKLHDAAQELKLFPSEESAEIEKIAAWSNSTIEGTRSGLPFMPSQAAWEQVSAESESCSHNQCPHFQDCFFFNARREAQDAQILVVNHHLLLTDISKRGEFDKYEDPCILPAYKRIIIDEAHHLEELATEHFAMRLHRLELNRVMGRLASEKQGLQQGKLPMLKSKIQNGIKGKPSSDILRLIDMLTIELPALRHRLQDATNNAFDSLSDFVDVLKNPSDSDDGTPEKKLRLLEEHQQHQKWLHEVHPQTSILIESIKEYRQALISMEATLKVGDDDRLLEQTKSIRIDILGLGLRLESFMGVLTHFLSTIEGKSKVRWIETQQHKLLNNVHLVDADLDVAKSLVNNLFSKFPTIILCSATLAANKEFQFVRKRLGLTAELLPDKVISEHLYESPFNYKQQALLAVPTDIPHPTHPDFNAVAFESIWKAVQACQGQAFVLFTSYTMLKQCHEALAKRFAEHRYPLFKQGDDSRQTLLRKFRSTERAVLFGTDSFWEGVDVAGDALRCVVIVKLPFKVPTEPIIQARTEAIFVNGGNPFIEYSVPQAVVKFKQGFGRLIRNKWDRGCIVCLDTRLVTKQYGSYFLNSLPDCEKVFMKGELLWEKMAEFYRKTYYYAKQNPFQ